MAKSGSGGKGKAGGKGSVKAKVATLEKGLTNAINNG